jgi:small subunit ribosomal protein S4
MARYRGPKCRLSRREKTDLMLKSGIRDIESKCQLDKTPGVQWQSRTRLSDYGIQLRMKQLIRRYYDVMEKQFHRYYKKADRMKGSTGSNLLTLLESRLDNVVYRMGFASTRAESRQLVSHKSVMVNDVVVNIASYHVSVGDVVEIRSRAKGQLRIAAAMAIAAKQADVEWLEVNEDQKQGVFKAEPQLDALPAEFKVNLVVEFYSK